MQLIEEVLLELLLENALAKDLNYCFLMFGYCLTQFFFFLVTEKLEEIKNPLYQDPKMYC